MIGRSTSVLVGAGALLAWTLTVWMGRGCYDKKGAPAPRPPGITKPETKPLIPKLPRLESSRPIISDNSLETTLSVTKQMLTAKWVAESSLQVYRALYDSCLAASKLPTEFFQVFEGRKAHTGDTVGLDLRTLSLTLTPFGFVEPTPHFEGVKSNPGGPRRSFLEFGGILASNAPDWVWGTFPLPREKRFPYSLMPQRAGGAYTPLAKEGEKTWGISFSWSF